jgi:hypothetical protein
MLCLNEQAIPQGKRLAIMMNHLSEYINLPKYIIPEDLRTLEAVSVLILYVVLNRPGIF